MREIFVIILIDMYICSYMKIKVIRKLRNICNYSDRYYPYN